MSDKAMLTGRFSRAAKTTAIATRTGFQHILLLPTKSSVNWTTKLNSDEYYSKGSARCEVPH